MFYLEHCIIVEVSMFGIFKRIHLPTVCIEHFHCARQCVFLVWDTVFALGGAYGTVKIDPG